MINLPNVTLIIVDTQNYGLAMNAIQKSLKEITPARTIFFTNIELEMPGIDVVKIPHLYNKSGYSRWMMKELGKQDIQTSHILIIQHDGYVLDGSQWTDEFLEYDYLGAPWLEGDGMNVGNGGFSLRSTQLHRHLFLDSTIKGIQPEDVGICRIYRDYLEQTYHLRWAPEDLAHRFSYELHEPKGPTFGFHGPPFYPSYVEPIVIRRMAAMGDVIGVEPVLEHFHRLGHPVYLDTTPEFYMLFATHYFKVGDYSKFDKSVIKHRVINLDLAYEVKPNQLHLKSYFEFAGVKDYQINKPRLVFTVNDYNRLFNNYVVLHIDEREQNERNIQGVKWNRVVNHLEDKGYTVITIGKGKHPDVGVYYNTTNPIFLMWLIAGCQCFIGIDSGPSHVAVALAKKCLLFFGSVDPRIIHPDLTDITVLQSGCPAGTPNCWHLVPSTTGQPCSVDKEAPPCTIHSTYSVCHAIDQIL